MSSRTSYFIVGLVFVALTVGATAAAAQEDGLVAAAASQDREAALALLDEGADVNQTRADGTTALLWAAHWDDAELAERLLADGADVNAADDRGVTALERATENASPAMVEALLKAGADATVARDSGLTPLMTAARTGNTQVVRALIGAGADVNAAVTATRGTALMWAVTESHGEIVRLLLDAGADPTISTFKGFTPLMFAARNGDVETGRALLDAEVDVNALSADETHVLPYAILMGQPGFTMFLIEQGADPNGGINGVPALHVASGDVRTWMREWYTRHGGNGLYTQFMAGTGLNADQRLPIVRALLDRGADPNGRIKASAMIMSYIGWPRKGAFEPFACGTGDLLGATPLFVAAYDLNGAGGLVFGAGQSYTSSSVEILRILLDAGADQHLTSVDGTTPLMMAAGLGEATYTPREPRGIRSPSAEEAVKFLVEAGGDIDVTNEADFTALHGAAFRGLNEVIEYLAEQGADIDARDFRGRTAYRMAEGSKQSFQFQSWPETAQFLADLGADTSLGIPGTVQERLRDTSPDDLLEDVNEP